jgi:hypothetical protein
MENIENLDFVTPTMKLKQIAASFQAMVTEEVVCVLAEVLDPSTQNKLFQRVKCYLIPVKNPKKKENSKKDKKNAPLDPEEQQILEQENEGVLQQVVGVYAKMKGDVVACLDGDIEITNCLAKIPTGKIQTKEDVKKLLSSIMNTEENMNRLNMWNAYVYGMIFRQCSEFVKEWNIKNIQHFVTQSRNI